MPGALKFASVCILESEEPPSFDKIELEEAAEVAYFLNTNYPIFDGVFDPNNGLFPSLFINPKFAVCRDMEDTDFTPGDPPPPPPEARLLPKVCIFLMAIVVALS